MHGTSGSSFGSIVMSKSNCCQKIRPQIGVNRVAQSGFARPAKGKLNVNFLLFVFRSISTFAFPLWMRGTHLSCDSIWVRWLHGRYTHRQTTKLQNLEHGTTVKCTQASIVLDCKESAFSHGYLSVYLAPLFSLFLQPLSVCTLCHPQPPICRELLSTDSRRSSLCSSWDSCFNCSLLVFLFSSQVLDECAPSLWVLFARASPPSTKKLKVLCKFLQLPVFPLFWLGHNGLLFLCFMPCSFFLMCPSQCSSFIVLEDTDIEGYILCYNNIPVKVESQCQP